MLYLAGGIALIFLWLGLVNHLIDTGSYLAASIIWGVPVAFFAFNVTRFVIALAES